MQVFFIMNLYSLGCICISPPPNSDQTSVKYSWTHVAMGPVLGTAGKGTLSEKQSLAVKAFHYDAEKSLPIR